MNVNCKVKYICKYLSYLLYYKSSTFKVSGIMFWKYLRYSTVKIG